MINGLQFSKKTIMLLKNRYQRPKSKSMAEPLPSADSVPSRLRNALNFKIGIIMEKEAAEKLMKIYSDAAEILNLADPILRRISNEDEKKTLLKALGGIFADFWLTLQLPIVRQYPELDPDKDEEWFKQNMKNRQKIKD
jgi:hypothetical protein